MKLFRNQFIYVEVAKKQYPKTEDPQVYNDFSIGCDNVHCGTTFHVQESLRE